jgi:hypothetical protein
MNSMGGLPPDARHFRPNAANTSRSPRRSAQTVADGHWPCLDTLAGLELELVSNSSSNLKLTLALEVFG